MRRTFFGPKAAAMEQNVEHVEHFKRWKKETRDRLYAQAVQPPSPSTKSSD